MKNYLLRTIIPAVLGMQQVFFLNVRWCCKSPLLRALGLLIALFSASGVQAQINITTVNTPFREDFNTLAQSGTSSTVPNGFTFVESGTSANNTYTGAVGSGSTGDTYSYGPASNTDRAFGGLRSGALIPTIGASFVNNSGITITSLVVGYTGEQWRIGDISGRTDQLIFEYSTNATSLTTGTYIAVPALNFTTPSTTGPTGAKDGNAAANRRVITSTITGLSIAPGATFWIRFTDFDAAGSDDGLAIDDFSLMVGCPSIAGTLNGTSTICSGSSTNLTATITGGTGPYSLTYSNGVSTSIVTGYTSGSPITVTPASSRTYTITNIVDANACTGTASGSAVVTVNPAPVFTSQPAASSVVCQGTLVRVGVTATNATAYQWYKGNTALTDGGRISGATTATLTITGSDPADTGGYTVVISGASPCAPVTSSAFSLTVNATPTATLTSSNSLNCGVTSATLTANGATGPGTDTFAFSNGATQINSTNQATVTTGGPYSVTVTSASSCTNVATTSVASDTAVPTVTLTSSNSLNCTLTSATLTAGATPAGSYTYAFSSGATQVNSTNQATISTGGPYSVTITGVNGCTNVATTSVASDTVVPMVSITANPSLSINAGASTMLTASGASSYTWSTGETTATITVTPTATAMYSVTGVSTGGCSGTATVTVVVNQPPVASVISNQTATVGQAYSFTVPAFTDPDNQPLTYTASIVPANGLAFDGTTRVISGTPTTTGVSSVTVTATDPGNLSASQTFTITVNPVPCPQSVTNVTTSETFCTIQAAINASNTVGGHVISVGSGVYDEQVSITKSLTIVGVGGTKPVINYTGTPALANGHPTAFDVLTANVRIENLQFNVDLTKLSSAILASAANISNLAVVSNDINPYRTGAITSTFGNRNAISINYGGPINYRLSNSNTSGLLIQGNTVTYNTYGTAVATDDAGFRAGVATDEGGGIFTGNTLQSTSADILVRFAQSGAVSITNNNINGFGVELADFNAGASSLSITGNTFNGSFGSAFTSSLRLKNNQQAIPTTVSVNTFTGHNLGISSENYQALTVDNNTFTPATGSTTYKHITVNTKEFSSSSGIIPPAIALTLTNNTFNGSSSPTSGTALAFANQDNDNPTFGPFVLGTVGNENKFAASLGTFIYLVNATGTVNPNATSAAPFAVDLNVVNDLFDVGNGLQLPSAMSAADRATLEAKLFHKPDNAVLGLITYFYPVRNVTQASSYSTIQSAIDAASANDVIELAEYTFSEHAAVTKPLTITGVSQTGTIIDGTGLAAGNGFTLQDNISGISIGNLTIRKQSGSANTMGNGIYGKTNNNLTITNVTSVSNAVHGIILETSGTLTNVSVTNSTLSNNGTTPGVNGRGFVIFNNLKQNITVANNLMQNNGLTGIDFNEGTATGVTITGNTTTGNGDEGIGLLGALETGGANLIANNTITDNGRYGIEVKSSIGTGATSGAGSLVIENNTISRTTDLPGSRDIAGISVTRRGAGVSVNTRETPQGAVVQNNTVTGFINSGTGDGFGIVVEGINYQVTGNTVSGNDVGLQEQQTSIGQRNRTAGAPNDGDSPYDMSDYFDRGNSIYSCGVVTGNTTTGNTLATRAVGASAAGRGLVTNITTGATFCTIQSAVDAATAGNSLSVSAGTYDELVTVSKGLTIQGSGASSIVNFTGTVPGGATPTLFKVTAPDVTIADLNFSVDLSKAKSAIHTSGTTPNLHVLRNVITPTGTPSGSYGIRNAIAINPKVSNAGYTFDNTGFGGVVVQGNTVNVSAGGIPNSFRAGVQMDQANGTIGGSNAADGNTLTSINHDVNVRFSIGPVIIQNNTSLGGGIQFAEPNGAGSLITIANNSLTGANVQPSTGVLQTGALMRIQNKSAAITLNVTNNTFADYRWAMSVENFNTITLDGNTFTPRAGNTDYRSISFNTKLLASSSATVMPVNIGATLTNNTFNGSGTPGGTAIAFFNHRQDGATPAIGAFTLGTAGSENTFNAGIATFLRLDNSTGPSSAFNSPFGDYTIAGAPSTTMNYWTPDLNAINNRFDVGTGSKLATNLSSADRAALAGQLFDKNDDANVGRIIFYTPVQNVTQNTFFPTIQSAVDAAASGDVISVQAGTYAENVTVPKSLTILGANSGVNPVTGTRSAETIVLPAIAAATDASTTGPFNVFTLNAQNIVIDGFTLDGDNPSLSDPTNSTTINGANIDASAGISGYGAAVTGGTVRNNIIKNFTFDGVDFGSDAGPTFNTIENNSFDNIAYVSQATGSGQAVVIYNNAYAAITGNTATRVRVGVQTNNNDQPTPTGTPTISGNTITAYRTGIFHNLQYASATGFTIANNTVTGDATLSGTSPLVGISIASIQTAVPVTVSGNTVNAGFPYGVEAWNTPTTGAVVLSGGSVQGSVAGVNVTTRNRFGDAGPSSKLTVSGVTISNSPVGVLAFDDPASANGISASVVVTDNTQITGVGAFTAVAISGPDASANITGNASSFVGNGSGTGVDINGGSASVTANRITNFATGINVSNGGQLTGATNNFITTNTNGLIYEATAGATQGVVTINDLSANTGKAIINGLTSTTINASCNYFGAPSATINPTYVTGNVSTTQVLANNTDEDGAAAGFQNTSCFTPPTAPVLTVSAPANDYGSPNNTYCIGENPTVTTNYTTGTNSFTVQSVGSGSTTVTTGNSVTITQGADTYYVYATNTQNGYTSPVSSTYVQIQPVVTSFTSNKAAYCVGETVSLSALGCNVATVSQPNLYFVRLRALDGTNNPNNGTAGLASGATSYSYTQFATTAPLTYTITAECVNGGTGQVCGTTSLAITANPLPVATLVSSNTLTCAAPTATLTAGGGQTYVFDGPGIVSQNGSATALVNAAGPYSVTVTSAAGCVSTTTTTVFSDTAVPTATLMASNSLNCAVTSATLTANASGGTSYTYTFSNGAAQIGTTNQAVATAGGPYSVTVTTANGCSTVATTTIMSDTAAPAVTLVSNNTLTCSVTSATLTATGGVSYAFSGPGLVSSDPVAGTAVVNASGTYSVTATAPNGCSSTTTTSVISNTAAPMATLTTQGSSTLTCAQTSVTLVAGGGVSYAFSGTGIVSQDASGTAIVNMRGVYSVTATAANGCTDVATVRVFRDTDKPTATLATQGSSTLTCAQTSVTLVASATGGTAPYTYLFSPDATTLSANQATVTTAGLYSVTATGANGCFDVANVRVFRDAGKPTAALTASNSGTLTCNQTSLTLTASATGGSTPYTYLFSPDATTISANQATVTTAGLYSVTAIGSNGCFDVANVRVFRDAGKPTATLTASGSGTLTCNQTSLTLTASATGGSSPYTYLFSPDATTISANQATVTTAGLYSVTAIGANGCTDIASVRVYRDTNRPTATLTTAGSSTLTCAQTSVTLVAGGGVSYAFSGTGIVSQDASGTAVVNTRGVYSVTATAANGCTDVATIRISSDTDKPTATLATVGGATITCNQPSVTLTASATGSSSYTYTFSAGATPVGPNQATVSTPGVYTVTVTGANGCTDMATERVFRDNARPTASLMGTTTICAGGTANLVATVSGGTTPYSLTYSDGASASAISNYTSGTNIPVSPTATSTYTIAVSGANGCTATITGSGATVTVNPLPNASLTTQGSSTLTCAQTSVTLVAGGGASYAFAGPGIVSRNGNTAIVNAAGMYSVTVTSAAGCSAVSTTMVSTNTVAPTVSLVSSGTISCSSPSVTLTASTNARSDTYAFSGPNGTIPSMGNTAVVSTGGVYSVTATSTNGCFSTTTTTVASDTAVPSATLVVSGAITCSSPTATLTANPATRSGTDTYAFAGPGGAIPSTGNTATIMAAGTYSVTVTSSNGCLSTATATVVSNTAVTSLTLTSSNNLSCGVTSATLTANLDPTGSRSAYTYAFSSGATQIRNTNQATVTTAGLYSVTATASNGCSSVANTSVTSDTAVTSLTLTSSNNLSCGVTSATLTASPDPAVRGAYTYVFSAGATQINANQATITTAGLYSVTATSVGNGCSVSATTSVTSSTVAPTVSLVASGTISCSSPSVTLTASTNARSDTYAFSGPNGSIPSTGNTAVVSTGGVYSVTATSTNGCFSTTTTTVASDTAVPSATLVVSGAITCASPTATLTANPATRSGTDTYAFAGPSGPIPSTGNTATVMAAGTYSVTVTSSNGCLSTASTSVTSDTAVTSLTLTSSNNLSCGVTSATLTANLDPAVRVTSYSYVFSPGAAQIGTSNRATITTGGPYSVTATSVNNGCSVSATTNITSDTALPTATLISSNSLNCGVTSATLTANIAGRSGTDTFTFSTGASQIGTSNRAIVTTGGPYSVTVTATNGCTNVATTTVASDTAVPSATLVVSGAITCSSPTATLTANPATRSGTDTYAFSGPSGPVSSTGNTATVMATGTYSVTVTSSNGCLSTATAMVVSDTAVTSLTLTSSNNLSCGVTSATLTASPDPTVRSAYTYVFSAGATPISANQATVTTAGLYSVTATSVGNGCSVSATTTVTSSTVAPTVSLVSSGTISCSSPSVTLTANTGTRTDTYAFSGPNGSIPSMGNTAVVNAGGVYSVTATSTNGCFSTTTTTVASDTAVPSATLVVSGAITCASPTATLTANPATRSGTDTYAFSGPSGPISSTGNTATVMAAGTYSVTVTSANSCLSTATTTVTSSTVAPTVSLVASGTISCSSPSVTLTASTNARTDTYAFSGPNGAIPSMGNTAVVNAGGLYSVTATSTNGCFSTTTTTVASDTAVPTATLTSSGTLGCNQTSVTLTAGGGQSYLFGGPGIVSQSASGSAVVNAAGTYSVTATSASGCSSTTTVVVGAEPVPTLSNATQAAPVCVGSPATINLTGLPENATLTVGYSINNVAQPSATVVTSNSSMGWRPSDPIPFQTRALTATDNGATLTITSLAFTSGGCSQTFNTPLSLTVNSAPTATLTASGTLTCAQTSVTLTANASGGSGYTYAFSAGANQLGATNQAVVTQAGPYSVTVTAATGCSVVATVTVSSSTSVATPNFATRGNQAIADRLTSVTVVQNTAPVMFSSTNCSGTLNWSGNGQMGTTTLNAPTSATGVFVYQATCTVGSCVSSPASVTVTVTPANTPPVPTANANQTATVGTQFTYTVNAFTDAQTPNNLTYSASFNPANGLTFNPATRVIMGTPQSTGVTSVTITATDPGMLSASTTFTITVNPAPVVTNLVVLQRDPDNGQLNTNTIKPYFQLQNQGTTPVPYSELTVRYYLTVENPAPIVAQINYAQLGTDKVHVTYVPLASPRQGATGYLEYSFDASAGSLGAMSNSGDVQNSVRKEDYSGFFQGDDYSYVLNRDFAINTRITAYRNGQLVFGTEPVALPGGNSPLTLTASANPTTLLTTGTTTLSATAAGGTAPYTYSFTGPGTISASGNTASVSNLPAGVQTFTVTASDATQPTAQTISATVSVTVSAPAPANTAPVATTNANQTATVGTQFTYTVNAFSDTETPNGLTYAAIISPANGLSFDPATRVVSGTPLMSGASTVMVTATDPGSLSASTTFTITVNPAPVVVTSLSLTASANPTMLLTTGTTTLSATAAGGTSPYTYSFTGPGTISASGNTASVSNLPAGVQTFTVVARDATSPTAQTISATVSVTVSAPAPANTAPVATTNANQTATVGTQFTYTVNAFSDAETPNGLTYAASISPANGLSFDPATRLISGTPSMSGVSTVTVTATDPGSLSASTTFTITVNPAPVVVTSLSLTASANPTTLLTTGTTTLSATAAGGTSPYTYSFTGPGTISANGNTASVSNLPAGVQTFTVTASDATQPTAQMISATVSVTVSAPAPANTAPVATTNANQTATVGTQFTYTVSAFTDAETPNGLTYAASISPANGLSFDPTTRVVSGTPSMSGVSTVMVTATDPGSLSASTTFTITVNPAPVVTTNLVVLQRDPDNGQLNTNTLKPYFQLLNQGTTPVPYSELTVRYWLTVENPAPIVAQINYAQLGTDKVHVRYVAQPRQGATGYLEYSFDASAGSLGAMSNSGDVQNSVRKEDYSGFFQGDDYSYVLNRDFAINTRITAYRNGQLVFGTEPGVNTRIAATKADAPLQVRVLGNPVRGAEILVEVQGAEGQPVQLRVTDLKGYPVTELSVKQAGAVEQQRLMVGQQPGGLLFLQVSTPTQTRTIKVLKVD